ncbi:hypothetical protein EKK58_10555 [Candidatus Dependentiae bacterium]|nr:MAG: hypothetical protein EKK58_10555 [Candidatus Dependentiae bacterium]
MTDVPIRVKISSEEAEAGKQKVVRSLSDIRAAAANTNTELKKIGNTTGAFDRLESRAKAAESRLRDLAITGQTNTVRFRTLQQATDRYRTSLEKAEAAISKNNRASQAAASSINLMQRAMIALGGAYLVKETIQMADSLTNLQNRLKLVTNGTEELSVVTKELFNISNQTRSSYESTAELYARTALATKELGLSQRETLDFTKSLNQAVILSGASAAEASAGIIQLSQGLASGTLRGDELRSVLEQLPAVADVIAKSLGVTRGQLRDLGAEGKITAKDIIDAFKKSADELNNNFGKTVPTIGQSLVVLKNSFLELLGEFDKSTGATSAVATGFMAISEALVDIINYMREARGEAALLERQLNALGNAEDRNRYRKLVDKQEDLGNDLVDVNEKISRQRKLFGGKSEAEILADTSGRGKFVQDEIRRLQKEREKIVGEMKTTINEISPLQNEINKVLANEAPQEQVDLNKKSPATYVPSASGSSGKKKKDPMEEILERRKRLLEEIRGPQTDYFNAQSDLIALLSEGKITLKEYNDELNQQELSFLKAKDASDFATAYSDQLRIMQLETKNASVEMGKMFAEVFGQGGELQQGIAQATVGALVYGNSWKEAIGNVARSISEKLLNQLIEVGLQIIFNTEKQLAFNAAAGASGGGGLFGSILGSIGSAFGGSFLGSQGSLSRLIGTGNANFIGPMQSFGGFASGGYTGNIGRNDVAGVVHGQEFVTNAQATSKYRSALEQMNAGTYKEKSQGGVKFTLINQAPGVEYEQNQISESEVEIIARRVVRNEAPKVISTDISNPNGRTSKALSNNLNSQRRRV